MARYVRQFRYYAEPPTEQQGGNKRDQSPGENQPKDLTRAQLISGSIFANCVPIYQLGIQTLPGTKFYLNNAENPTIINNTGIYELDLNGDAQINSISFSQQSIRNIDESIGGYLIIDILCGEEV